jgi:hypothetical protein
MEVTRELSRVQYDATFSPPMLNVTDSAEAIVDVWSYLDPVLDKSFPDADEWDWRVKHIYESRDGRFQHLYVAVPIDETYMLVIVDKPQKQIIGHYLLDLRPSGDSDA